MKAADIMTTKVFTIHNLATIAEAIALMQDKKVRSLIVEPSDDGEAYGIITETDIVYQVTARQKQPEEVMVYQIMTKPCIVVNPNLSLENVARLFAETGIQRGPRLESRVINYLLRLFSGCACSILYGRPPFQIRHRDRKRSMPAFFWN